MRGFEHAPDEEKRAIEDIRRSEGAERLFDEASAKEKIGRRVEVVVDMEGFPPAGPRGEVVKAVEVRPGQWRVVIEWNAEMERIDGRRGKPVEEFTPEMYEKLIREI